MKVKCLVRNPDVNSTEKLYDKVNVTMAADYQPSRPYEVLTKYGFRRERKCDYVLQFATFDIETTSITHYENETTHMGKYHLDYDLTRKHEKADYAFMYTWSMCIDGEEVVGRTWEEFLDVLGRLKAHYGLSDERFLVIYVHNLPFEFTFLQGYINDYSDIFATAERKILTWRVKRMGIEFRCSQRLTNKSLERFTNDTVGCKHIKAKDDLDYSKIRHSCTKLTETEWGYIVNDTLGLWEALTYKMNSDGDNVISIPSTSTGYVRRRMRESCNTASFRTLKERIALTKDVYTILKEAFRGGDTHANKVKCGKIYNDVYSYDASSMYPAMQLLRKYPMSRFEKMAVTGKTLKYLSLHREYAWCCRITLRGVRMKENQYNPYLSISKCKINANAYIDNDNGRVWKCDELKTSILDVDWDIIKECYDFDDVEIEDGSLYISRYGYLPNECTSVIMELFVDKNQLKIKVKNAIVENLSVLAETTAYDLSKSKEMLNGVYGMSATDPIHDLMWYNDNEWIDCETYKYMCDSDYKDKIDNELTSKGIKMNDIDFNKLMISSVLPYQWGVWCPAHARKHLREILACAGSDYIYCDTDSCKATMFDWDKLDALNNRTYAECEERKVYVDVAGKRCYIGYFDCESALGDKRPEYARFMTLGAKKYCYDEYKSDGTSKFGCTISGVRKKEGVKALKKIENFKVGFRIEDSGGQNATYYDSDQVTKGTIVDYNGLKGNYEYTGFNCLTHREYVIGVTDKQFDDYELIDYIAE